MNVLAKSLLAALIICIVIEGCNSDSISAKNDGFGFYFEKVANYNEFIPKEVKWVKYNSNLDTYDTLSKSVSETVILVNSLLSDSLLLKKVYQEKGIGYVKLLGDENGVNIILEFKQIETKWVLSKIDDLST